MGEAGLGAESLLLLGLLAAAAIVVLIIAGRALHQRRAEAAAIAAIRRDIATRPAPRPPAPPRPAILPPTDAAEEAPRDTGSAAFFGDLLDRVYLIDYVDAGGAASRRRIAVRRIWDNETHLALQAWCYERRAARRFLTNRVRALADGVTGEIIPDCDGHFRALLALASDRPRRAPPATQSEPSAETIVREALHPLRHEMHLLLGVARADEDLHPAEVAVIAGWLRAHSELFALFESDTVAMVLHAIWPSEDSLDRAARAIGRRRKADRLAFFTLLHDVMLADAKQDPRELALLAMLESAGAPRKRVGA